MQQTNPLFKAKSLKTKKGFFPTVSVCTPTFNRRPFISNMLNCFRNQKYPKSCIEWIIVDDGTDPIEDIIMSSGIENIKYYRLSKKMHLGEKRNFTHSKATGSILVYMDDDDYYPPERISHAVERLQSNKNALCAGASEIYVYYKHIHKMVQCGPYGPNHATAGTFAFRAELLKQTQYENTASLAEERAFLKNYTIPFVQLDPLKTILVFSHNHNSFDKKKMLEHLNTPFCKESNRTVDDFIHEPPAKQFFMVDIDNLLATYPVGEPHMKPDVLEGIQHIETERQRILQSPASTTLNITPNGKITLCKEGSPPLELGPHHVMNIIQQQEQKIQLLMQRIEQLQRTPTVL